jgi:hypothetical protein
MAVTAVPLTERLGGPALSGPVDPATHLVARQLPPSHMIHDSSYVPNQGASGMVFGPLAARTRAGVFDVTDTGSGVRRAFLVFVPDGGPAPTDVLYGILPSLGQAADYWRRLQAHLPVSDAMVADVLSMVGMDDVRPGMVKAHYVQQVMTCLRRRYALIIPVRSLSSSESAELGPFGTDGRVITDALAQIAQAAGGAFSPLSVDAFAHSAGGFALHRLLRATRLRHVIAIDTNPPARPSNCSGVAKLYVSGFVHGSLAQVGGRSGAHAGAEYVPFRRWGNEPTQASVLPSIFANHQTNYLHNWAFPRYLLRVGLQAT